MTVRKPTLDMGSFCLKRYLLWTGSTIAALLLIYFMTDKGNSAQFKIYKEPSVDGGSVSRMTGLQERSKVILIWTKFVKSIKPDWDKIFRRAIEGHCPYNCTITYDDTYWDTADAIIFKRNNESDFPPKHNKNQIWILFSIEAATHESWVLPSEWRSVFDWTMTYHHQSEVVMPYGLAIPRKHTISGTLVPAGRDYWSEKQNKRAKLVSWLVSKCSTPSGRENFVSELQRYVEVDIYGSCGPFKCGGRMILPRMNVTNDRDECYDLMGSYMFYLAFENSICDDYVTEKFFRALQMDAIPVVYGGGNYEAVAPPHSYINAMDFESPLVLAKYLRIVAENQTLYNSYFQWKRKYSVELGFPFNPMICDLCARLQGKPTEFSKHRNSAGRTKTGKYKDVSKWFTTISKCRILTNSTEPYV